MDSQTRKIHTKAHEAVASQSAKTSQNENLLSDPIRR